MAALSASPGEPGPLPDPAARGRPGRARAPGPVTGPGHDPGEAVVLDQGFDSATLGLLRKRVAACAAAAGMPAGRVVDITLAVHELAANAITHGRETGRLQVWDLAGALHCQVDDGDPPAPGDPARVSRLPDLAGHGLWVVRHIADQMQIASGPRGTRVTVTFNARGPE